MHSGLELSLKVCYEIDLYFRKKKSINKDVFRKKEKCPETFANKKEIGFYRLWRLNPPSSTGIVPFN